VTLLVAGMLAGFSGSILPDDMLSGGSLSVFTGVLLAVPYAGTHIATIVFGGSFPGDSIIPRAYWVHILVLPLVLGGLLALSYRPRLGFRFRPDPLLPMTFGVLAVLGTAAQINPVWLYGPYQPGSITSGAVPDWYMGFLDGALRIMPGWEISIGGHPLTLAVLVPGVVIPGMFFTLLGAYPLFDGWVTRSRLLLPRRADPANRVAVGVAGVTFYGVLWAAAANDEIAYHLNIALYSVTWAFRVLVVAGPVVAFVVTRVFCHAVADRKRAEQEHGRETGRIVQAPDGGFSEILEVPVERERAVSSPGG
jgi:ubiquinol-cytochrome c reductase cytochrome b subunit